MNANQSGNIFLLPTLTYQRFNDAGDGDSDLVDVVDLLEVAPRYDGVVPLADWLQHLVPVLLLRCLEKRHDPTLRTIQP